MKIVENVKVFFGDGVVITVKEAGFGPHGLVVFDYEPQRRLYPWGSIELLEWEAK